MKGPPGETTAAAGELESTSESGSRAPGPTGTRSFKRPPGPKTRTGSAPSFRGCTTVAPRSWPGRHGIAAQATWARTTPANGAHIDAQALCEDPHPPLTVAGQVIEATAAELWGGLGRQPPALTLARTDVRAHWHRPAAALVPAKSRMMPGRAGPAGCQPRPGPCPRGKGAGLLIIGSQEY